MGTDGNDGSVWSGLDGPHGLHRDVGSVRSADNRAIWENGPDREGWPTIDDHGPQWSDRLHRDVRSVRSADNRAIRKNWQYGEHGPYGEGWSIIDRNGPKRPNGESGPNGEGRRRVDGNGPNGEGRSLCVSCGGHWGHGEHRANRERWPSVNNNRANGEIWFIIDHNRANGERWFSIDCNRANAASRSA